MNVLGPLLWLVQNKNNAATSQVMSPKHKTSVVDMNAAHSNFIAMSGSIVEHYPLSIVSVACFVPLGRHKDQNSDFYQPVQDPARDTGGPNGFWSFYFKLYPPEIPEADDDGLEDTQGMSSANGHTSDHAVNIENKFASKIMEENVSNQKLL